MVLKGLLVLCLFVTLAACGGTPVRLDQVPVPSNAKESTANDPIVTSMQDSMKQSLGNKVSKFEVKTYAMPKDSDWATIKSFYTDQLKADWKAEDAIALETDMVSMKGWTRGALASEQALIVGYIPDPTTGEPTLMVMLASE
jgi:hypothetical protein